MSGGLPWLDDIQGATGVSGLNPLSILAGGGIKLGVSTSSSADGRLVNFFDSDFQVGSDGELKSDASFTPNLSSQTLPSHYPSTNDAGVSYQTGGFSQNDLLVLGGALLGAFLIMKV